MLMADIDCSCDKTLWTLLCMPIMYSCTKSESAPTLAEDSIIEHMHGGKADKRTDLNVNSNCVYLMISRFT
jgi:hypothetical protein